MMMNKPSVKASLPNVSLTISTLMSSPTDRRLQAVSLMADSIVGRIGKFQWEVAVARIGQLASEIRLSMGGQSIGGSNGNADELMKWDGTKKNGLGW
jgi:hypothetical protein